MKFLASKLFRPNPADVGLASFKGMEHERGASLLVVSAPHMAGHRHLGFISEEILCLDTEPPTTSEPDLLGMVTVPCCGGGICSFLEGAPAIQQLTLLRLVAAEQRAEPQVSVSNGHTPATKEGLCLQTLSDVLHSLLAIPGCNPLRICFFNHNSGPQRRKWHQKIVFWQQLLQHDVFSLVICLSFSRLSAATGCKGRTSIAVATATKTRGKVLPRAALGLQSHVTSLRCLRSHITSLPALVGRWGAWRKANALLGVELCGGHQEAGTRPGLPVTCHTPASHRSLPVR